ncbi:MAG: enoyl-CoA hydratase-related protein [Alphaproteobacteria bacterium]|jgi:enoyl-CoA hydratase|nr:enoyl-CoA hydratase-related protein [Alphaproteobacteria bacterium]
MANYETLEIEKEGAVDWLTLNRPERLNALNSQMVDELGDYFHSLCRDEEVRIVVMRGAGRAFCAGIDIKEIRGVVANGIPPDIRGQRRVSEIIMAMRRCPQPIVALVQGAATGGGLGLMLAADIRIAGASARMNCAFLKLGLTSCDVGVSYMLPRMIGLSAASELMLTGRFMGPERALATGLVSEVVADERLKEAAKPYLEEMLAASPLGLKLTKECLNMTVDAPSLEAAIALEDRNQVLTIQSPNFTEGINAFFEKREPVYRDQ